MTFRFPLAAQNYTFQTILSCNNLTAFPCAMNGSGVVVGVVHNIYGPAAGMIYSAGQCRTYPKAYFYGITDNGSLLVTFPPSPTMYPLESGGKILGPLPNYPGTGGAVYCCMDTLTGTLAGNYWPGPEAGFFYKGGTFASLYNETGGNWLVLAAFSNTGIAVGTTSTTGFVYQNRKITSLQFPGGKWTNFNGINDNGLVVGSYTNVTTGAINVCTYDIATGAWTDLNFPYPYDNMTPVGISSTGVIALQYSYSGGMVIATPSGN